MKELLHYKKIMLAALPALLLAVAVSFVLFTVPAHAAPGLEAEENSSVSGNSIPSDVPGVYLKLIFEESVVGSDDVIYVYRYPESNGVLTEIEFDHAVSALYLSEVTQVNDYFIDVEPGYRYVRLYRDAKYFEGFFLSPKDLLSRYFKCHFLPDSDCAILRNNKNLYLTVSSGDSGLDFSFPDGSGVYFDCSVTFSGVLGNYRFGGLKYSNGAGFYDYTFEENDLDDLCTIDFIWPYADFSTITDLLSLRFVPYNDGSIDAATLLYEFSNVTVRNRCPGGTTLYAYNGETYRSFLSGTYDSGETPEAYYCNSSGLTLTSRDPCLVLSEEEYLFIVSSSVSDIKTISFAAAPIGTSGLPDGYTYAADDLSSILFDRRIMPFIDGSDRILFSEIPTPVCDGYRFAYWQLAGTDRKFYPNDVLEETDRETVFYAVFVEASAWLKLSCPLCDYTETRSRPTDGVPYSFGCEHAHAHYTLKGGTANGNFVAVGTALDPDVPYAEYTLSYGASDKYRVFYGSENTTFESRYFMYGERIAFVVRSDTTLKKFVGWQYTTKDGVKHVARNEKEMPLLTDDLFLYTAGSGVDYAGTFNVTVVFEDKKTYRVTVIEHDLLTGWTGDGYTGVVNDGAKISSNPQLNVFFSFSSEETGKRVTLDHTDPAVTSDTLVTSDMTIHIYVKRYEDRTFKVRYVFPSGQQVDDVLLPYGEKPEFKRLPDRTDKAFVGLSYLSSDGVSHVVHNADEMPYLVDAVVDSDFHGNGYSGVFALTPVWRNLPSYDVTIIEHNTNTGNEWDFTYSYYDGEPLFSKSDIARKFSTYESGRTTYVFERSEPAVSADTVITGAITIHLYYGLKYAPSRLVFKYYVSPGIYETLLTDFYVERGEPLGDVTYPAIQSPVDRYSGGQLVGTYVFREWDFMPGTIVPFVDDVTFTVTALYDFVPMPAKKLTVTNTYDGASVDVDIPYISFADALRKSYEENPEITAAMGGDADALYQKEYDFIAESYDMEKLGYYFFYNIDTYMYLNPISSPDFNEEEFKYSPRNTLKRFFPAYMSEWAYLGCEHEGFTDVYSSKIWIYEVTDFSKPLVFNCESKVYLNLVNVTENTTHRCLMNTLKQVNGLYHVSIDMSYTGAMPDFWGSIKPLGHANIWQTYNITADCEKCVVDTDRKTLHLYFKPVQGAKEYTVNVSFGKMSVGEAIGSGIGNTVSGLWDGITGIAQNVWNFSKGLLSEMLNGISGGSLGTWLWIAVGVIAVLFVVSLLVGIFRK